MAPVAPPKIERTLQIARRSADNEGRSFHSQMRRPDGFVCPSCSHDKGGALRGKAHTFECAGRRRQTSVTAGTVMHAGKLAPTGPPA